jgi:Zn-dependent metalloprotease
MNKDVLMQYSSRDRDYCFIISDKRLAYLEEQGDMDAKRTREMSNIIRGQREILSQISLGLGITLQAEKHGKYRVIYDAGNSERKADPRDIIRTEDRPFHGRPESKTDSDQAFDYSGYTYDFYNELFKRKSIDDANMELHSTIQFRRRFVNAFWDGQSMTYGEGMTKCIDVVAHELTHGVTEHEANLQYRDQPGALNEHFSDVMGILVKQRHLNQTVTQSNWLIGENVAAGIDALRSMKDPGSLRGDDQVLDDGRKVDHINNYYNGDEDRGGVHINSGIPNKAFYLAATSIGGHAWEIAGNIWYIVLRDKLHRMSTFQEAANFTFEVAAEYYDNKVQSAVRKGWADVGIQVEENIGKDISSLIGIRA